MITRSSKPAPLNAQQRSLALITSSLLLVCGGVACGGEDDLWDGETLDVASFALRRGPVPSGYQRRFSSTFERTTIKASKAGDWWYTLSGGESGYSWANARSATGDARPIRIQTMVGGGANLNEFQEASIVSAAGRGDVLKLENKRDDGAQGLARLQLYTKLQGRNRVFVRYDALLPTSLKEALKKGGWALLSEFHDNGKYRVNLGVRYDREARRHEWRIEVREGTRLAWPRISAAMPDGHWGRWINIAWMLECRSNQKGLIRAWIDGERIADVDNKLVGYPMTNVHPAKLYVARESQRAGGVAMQIDDLEIYTP